MYEIYPNRETLTKNFDANSELTNIQTDERKDENYIPVGINAGGIKNYIPVGINAGGITSSTMGSKCDLLKD